MKRLLIKIRKILRDRRTRRFLTRIISITAAIVVFVTTYALVLPAITMERDASCGVEAHQHTDECYRDELVCGLEESPGHQHDESCYKISQVLVCEMQEHVHNETCRDADGNLICGMKEHIHSAACYKEQRELICEIPETEGHTHTADCYEKVLDCNKEVHIHSAACYVDPEVDLDETEGTEATSDFSVGVNGDGESGSAPEEDYGVVEESETDAADEVSDSDLAPDVEEEYAEDSDFAQDGDGEYVTGTDVDAETPEDGLEEVINEEDVENTGELTDGVNWDESDSADVDTEGEVDETDAALEETESEGMDETDTSPEEAETEDSEETDTSLDETVTEGEDVADTSLDETETEGSDETDISLEEAETEGADEADTSLDETEGEDETDASLDEVETEGEDETDASLDETEGTDETDISLDETDTSLEETETEGADEADTSLEGTEEAEAAEGAEAGAAEEEAGEEDEDGDPSSPAEAEKGTGAEDADLDSTRNAAENAEADSTEEVIKAEAESGEAAAEEKTAGEVDTYVPELDSLNFNALLNKKTGIYYYDAEEGEEVENSAELTEWNRVEEDTELEKNDILRVYLAYTIPAGSLNETNPTARYRLPENIFLTDAQIEAINKSENGIAAQYVNYDALEITDPGKYHMYLGAEAVEGERRPDEKAEDYLKALTESGKDASEYISATVKAENVYDEEGIYGEKGAYLGQDLIFTFVQYTIEKNRHEYKADGTPKKAGEKVSGWFTFDVTTEQVKWVSLGENVVLTNSPEEGEDGEISVNAEAADKDEESADAAAERISDEVEDEESSENAEAAENDEESAAAAAERISDEVEDEESSENAEAAENDEESADAAAERIPEEGEDGEISENAEAAENDEESADAAAERISDEVEDEEISENAEAAENDEESADAAAERISDEVEDEEIFENAEAAENDEESADTAAERTSEEEDGTEISENAEAADKDEESVDAAERLPEEGDSTDISESVEDFDSLDSAGTVETRIREYKSAVIFVSDDKELGIDEIRTDLRMTETYQVVVGTVDKDAEDRDIIAEDSEIETTEGSEENPDDAAEESEVSPEIVDKEESEVGSDSGSEAVSADSTDANEIKEEEKTIAEQVSYPAVTFDDSINVRAGKLPTDTGADEDTETRKDTAGNEKAGTDDGSVFSVHVEASEGTFPEGTTMRLGQVPDKQMEAVTEAVAGAVEGKTKGFHAIDISFWNTNGVEIEPLKPISVSIKSDSIREAVEDSSTVPVVVHVDDGTDVNMSDDRENEESGTDEKNTEENNTDNSVAEDESGIGAGSVGDLSEPEDNRKSSGTEANANSIETDAPLSASIVEIDSGDGKETSENSNEKTGQNAAENDTLTFKAEAFSVYAVVYTVDFHYEVDGKMHEFSIPGGGFVTLQQLVEVLGISYSDAYSENASDSEENSGDFSEDVDDYSLGEVPGVEEGNAYEEGGNEYNSGEEQSVSNIVNSTTTYLDVQIGEKTREFVSNVESVEFSDASLVWVGKVGQTATVGGLKEANGLEVQYSAELTEEQIEEINAQTVENGDWALICMQPFTSEESLIVTMKTGEVFTVAVTDGQLHTYVISDSGDTYEVIVTYDDTANIPDDAKLVVKEISDDSDEFAENIDLVNEELKAKDESEVSNPVQFDISIVSGGVEIEPKEGSVVNVEIRLAKSLFAEDGSEEKEPAFQTDDKDSEEGTGLFLFNGQEITIENSELTGCRIAHIAKDGSAEIVDEVENSFLDEKLVMRFETSSFSDYLFDGNSGHQLNNLPSTIYVGDEIYMWNQANMSVSEVGNIVTVTTHNNGWSAYYGAQVTPDNYKTVTAKSPGTFRIYQNGNWNNGKNITVLPARTGTTPPSTIDTIDNASIGLTLNLFDYDLDNYLDDYYNGSSHYDNTCISDFASHGINSGNALKFWGSGIGNNYGSLNQYQEHGVTNIVNNTLNTGAAGGYPVVSNNAGGTGNRDLSYLFTPSDGTDKKAYTNVNHLFKKVDDYYVYDSNQNYAYYDKSQGSGGNFTVYNSTYEQKSSGEQTSTTNGKAIGFFPFHPWDEDYDLYVNWNKNLNHHFGMSMSVPFSLPKDPKAVVDTDGNPIVFEFSGDDDLWVFIDGKLAMDIGGIHQPTSGTINFQTGTVTVNGSTQLNSSTFNSRFSNLFDGKKHTLEVFYIERGGCDSNCKIQFNLTQYGDIHFDKVDKDNPSDKLAGAVFGIYKDADCTIPLMENLKNGTSRAYIAESDAQGHVQFSDIPLGTYYLKELHAPEGYPLDDTVHTVQVYIDQSTGLVKVTVTIDGVDVETGVNILNGKPAPINLGLSKVWQNTDGESITAPDGATTTFEIKRIRAYETYTETQIQGEGRDVSHLVVGVVHNGESHVYKEYDLICNTQATVSWSYNDGYEGSKDCIVNGTRVDKDYVTGLVVSEAITMLAAGQTATIYIVDDSENGEAVHGINVAGSQFYGNSGGGVIHTFQTITEQDPGFGYTGEHVTNNQVTLPINSNTWTYTFTNLPVFESGTVEGVDHVVAFNYSYYLEEVSSTCPEGTTVVYRDTAGNVINTPTAAETSESGTLTITNKVPTGYLRIDKQVTYNGISPVPDGKKSDLAGTYTFKVYTDSNCSKPYKVIQGEAPNQQEVDLVLTVKIEDDGTAKSSETVKIPIGNYWIEEQTSSQTGVTPDENRIPVPVTTDNTAEVPAIASFTNNKEESDNPDELAIELEKTFSGLPNASKIPGDYQATLTYTYNGSTVTVALTGSTQGNVTCVKSDDGMTWHWRITQIPKTATDFGVYESHYDITGYTRITKINGTEVANPGTPQAVTVLTPTITMTNISRDYTTPDNYKVFNVVDNQILLVRMTSQATVIVSPKSLSLATRQAIEKMITDNNGKIPGDDGAQATWVLNFVYFSHEIQGDSFSYGGRTIYFEGDQVKIPHKSSSHEVRVDINYTSTSAENSFTLENIYEEIPTEVDVLKVEKGKETTTQLPGAVFELRKLEDVAPTVPGGTLTYVKDENQQEIVTSKTTGDNGRLTFPNLTYGVYEIREVTPPPGYIKVEDVTFYLKVDGGSITYLQKGSNKPSEWTEASNNDQTATVYYMEAQVAIEDDQTTPEDETVEAVNATFRVSNEPGAALPNTGGPGTNLLYMIGLMLTALSGAGLVMRRRRREAA